MTRSNPGPRNTKSVAITASVSGENTLVAALTNRKIRVIAMYLSCSGTVNVKLLNGAGGADLTGPLYGVANSGIVLPENDAGWTDTASGVALVLNLSAAIAVGGLLVYEVI